MPKRNRIKRCQCWASCRFDRNHRLKETQENRLANREKKYERRDDFCQAEWDALSRLEDHEMECVDPTCCHQGSETPDEVPHREFES